MTAPFRTRSSPIALLALCACATTAPHPPTIGELTGTWQAMLAVPAGARIPTLNVGGDGSISGNGGVNKFRGSIELPALAEGRWRVGALTTTRMASSTDAMQLEDQFLRALANADSAELVGEELRMRRGSEILLSLGRVRFR